MNYKDVRYFVLGKPHNPFQHKGIPLLDELHTRKLMSPKDYRFVLVFLTDIGMNGNLPEEMHYFNIEASFLRHSVWDGVYLVSKYSHRDKEWCVPIKNLDPAMMVVRAFDWNGPDALWEFDCKFQDVFNRDHLRLEAYG